MAGAAVSWAAQARLSAGDDHLRICRLAIARLLTIAAAEAEERLPTIPPSSRERRHTVIKISFPSRELLVQEGDGRATSTRVHH